MQNYLLLLLLVFVLVACATPIAQFTYEGDTKAPASISFNNTSTNADVFEWHFGDQGESSELSPSFSFPKAGNYLVTLKASKGKKTATYYERINIEGPEACMVLIETKFGNMLLELYNSTPEHQANFLKLADEGYYNDLLFHRVMNRFMIQGGDPDSRGAKPGVQLGRGGPGYTIPAEFVDTLVHIKGALAAARSPDSVNPEKRSSGSQFYIVHGSPLEERNLRQQEAKMGLRYAPAQRKAYLEKGGYPPLDGNYTVFGRVLEGLEVIDKVTQSRTNSANRPLEDVKMKISVVDYFLDKKKP